MDKKPRYRKVWPRDGSTLMFDEITGPVLKAIKYAYKLERKNDGKRIPWSGPNVGPDTLVGCPGPIDRLSIDNLAYDLEDQGRDALEVIIGIAVQLGIEQGRRINENRVEKDLVRLQLDILSHHISELRKRFDQSDK